MPPVRPVTVRRSRRLSMQVPVKYDDDGWESGDVAMGLIDAVATHSPASPPASQTPTRRAPRSPNAFLQFRSTYWQGNKRERNNRNVSRICGILWNAMSAEERSVYEEMAAVARADHKLKYPHFNYRPVRRDKKPRTRRHRNYKEEDKCRKIAMLFRKDIEGTVIEKEEEVKTKELVCTIPSPTPPVIANEERAPTPDHATPTAKKEEEETFVPTSAMPPLDLKVSAADKDEFAFDSSVQPPSYVRVDAQFGANPDVNMDSSPGAPPVDDTARPEPFDPVANYLSDYVHMSEELDAMMTDIAPQEMESLSLPVDWAYI
ncbi:uncharacterized protein EV420DRAFT_1644969 [Desarmillaria tabescens]|uniref:HMG box domain-containing protein n=1 Tax=Armillaria tabescens TaxID=1929756 RepID=A0AA39N306_ARMTA|nr:uncharacterized protein EV420DRAFT_1644969 [Desarmillaria tabescens]KAK0455330.1 hypothetical protein EV420DRAFT_1644969 [Desarmillaria tabescens]